MTKDEIDKCRGGMELDTPYELNMFLDEVFRQFRMEALTEVNNLLNEHSFMGAEWQAINSCQSRILALLPTKLN